MSLELRGYNGTAVWRFIPATAVQGHLSGALRTPLGALFSFIQLFFFCLVCFRLSDSPAARLHVMWLLSIVFLNPAADSLECKGLALLQPKTCQWPPLPTE